MKKITLFLFVLLSFGLSTDAHAQKKKKKKGKSEQAAPKKKDPFNDIVKKCVKSEGLFTMYTDTVTGKSYFEVKDDQLGKEFIYFSYIENGLLDAGSFRGAYRGSKVIKFRKNYENIEVTEKNTDFYYDKNSPLSRASHANINEPILISEKIAATSKDKKTYLLDGNAIFLSEKFQMVKPPSNPKRPSFLGGLSKSKSKVVKINNYPQNTDVIVDYVYDNKNPRRGGSSAATDPRSVTIKYQHSLLEMPDNDFKPRRDDARMGYFMTQVNDMTSFDAAPYRDMIHRWNLVKKNPDAELSEPVKPITWWVENTTPYEFRDIIVEAVERWNIAFEKIGFKNAMVAKIQPDDADWDAGDIRYNVLRWTSSPNPPFGGYGPSFVNPETGEILGADVMLEFVSVSNRLFKSQVFETASLMETTQEEMEEISANQNYCAMGTCMQHNLAFGTGAIDALDLGEVVKKDIVKQTLYRLVLHEVGHTLGLTHNMRASMLQSPEDIKNKEKIAKEGLCNSVMEYPSINFALNPEEQTAFYDQNPGAYDLWAIEYGYSTALDDEQAEEKRLNEILKRSSEPNLMYGNDADDMRATGWGMDPDVNIFDLSSDPVAYGVDRCELVNKTIPKLLDKYTNPDKSYQELLKAYLTMTGEYGNQVRIMSRQIGGVHFDRSLPGQNTTKAPLTPVSEAKQKAAMNALTKYAFAPDILSFSPELYTHLFPQRRGFSHFGRGQDPKLQERILAIQKSPINHILNPNVIQRIINSENYGNTYTADEVLADLTKAIFLADVKSKVNVTRQNLQVYYVQQLIAMNGEKSKHTYQAKSLSNLELNKIKRMMKSASSPDGLTKAHRAYILQLIADYQEK